MTGKKSKSVHAIQAVTGKKEGKKKTTDGTDKKVTALYTWHTLSQMAQVKRQQSSTPDTGCHCYR